jgi:hypothetical protein
LRSALLRYTTLNPVDHLEHLISKVNRVNFEINSVLPSLLLVFVEKVLTCLFTPPSRQLSPSGPGAARRASRVTSRRRAARVAPSPVWPGLRAPEPHPRHATRACRRGATFARAAEARGRPAAKAVPDCVPSCCRAWPPPPGECGGRLGLENPNCLAFLYGVWAAANQPTRLAFGPLGWPASRLGRV